jgi:broad specificity phosphatase PhoE
MTIINFFLTRHGETQWNKMGKFQGQLDSPLTEKGYLQAKAIAKKLSNRNINTVFSSTLPRAKKTAEICQTALNCSLTLIPKLIERDFGTWQGKFIADVQCDNNYQNIFHQVNHIAPPNGESGIDCAVRFESSLIDIAEQQTTHAECSEKQQNLSPSKQKNILVVSHGDILRCFLSSIVNKFTDNQAINTQNRSFDNGCIFEINYNIVQQNFTLISVLDITQSEVLM